MIFRGIMQIELDHNRVNVGCAQFPVDDPGEQSLAAELANLFAFNSSFLGGQYDFFSHSSILRAPLTPSFRGLPSLSDKLGFIAG